MYNALLAADEIYSAALQIMNSHGIDAKGVPLIMGAVSHRLEAFAIGVLAHELSEAERQPETIESEE